MDRPPIEKWDEALGESINNQSFGDDVVFDLLAYIRHLEAEIDRAWVDESIEPLRETWQKIPPE